VARVAAGVAEQMRIDLDTAGRGAGQQPQPGLVVVIQNRDGSQSQSMAAHESPRTTKLYDRTKEHLTQDDVERIML
jgi:hypothetical protein